METSEDDFGGMDVAFVQEHLDDFNCSLATDALDDTLNKCESIDSIRTLAWHFVNILGSS